MVTIEILRQFRIGGYAIFDLVLAFVGMYLLSGLLSKLFLRLGIIVPKRNRVFLTLPIGISAHLLVGSFTLMTKDFLDMNGHYLIKCIVLISLLFGLRGINLKK